MGRAFSRISALLECKIQFHGRQDTLDLIQEYLVNKHPDVRVEYTEMEHWNMLPQLAASINEDHMFVIVTARTGTVSYKNAQERLPEEIKQFFSGKKSNDYLPRPIWLWSGSDDLCTTKAYRRAKCLRSCWQMD